MVLLGWEKEEEERVRENLDYTFSILHDDEFRYGKLVRGQKCKFSRRVAYYCAETMKAESFFQKIKDLLIHI